MNDLKMLTQLSIFTERHQKTICLLISFYITTIEEKTKALLTVPNAAHSPGRRRRRSRRIKEKKSKE